VMVRSQRTASREKNGFLWKKSDVCCSPTGLMSFYFFHPRCGKQPKEGFL
jgi:hypothetical protein